MIRTQDQLFQKLTIMNPVRAAGSSRLIIYLAIIVFLFIKPGLRTALTMQAGIPIEPENLNK